jgi:imidazolonepropionase-like amidohydrolase
VRDGALVLDCSACVITAGFWNSHVHFHERKWASADSIPASELARQLAELTRYGFTSVFDLSSSWENTRRLRDRIESGEVLGPHIRSTGEGLIPAGGTPSAEVFRVLGLMEASLSEVSDAAQAREVSKMLLAHGVDALKLFLSAPSGGRLPPDAIRASVEEAHRAGKPVFAHPNAASDIVAALDGGVDIIAHTTPRSGPWDGDLLRAMQAAKVLLIPTLMVWQSMMRHDRIGARDALVATAVAQLRAWLECGGAVLFGTDLGAVEYDPTDEYELMSRAGATFRDILASLTTTPAQRFDGEPNAGEVAAGRPADLVVLDEDPSRNAGALASVRYTVRAGEIIYGLGR